MEILFKIESEVGNNNKVITALFPSIDSRPSLKTIVKVMESLIPPEKKENIKFKSLYVGQYDFRDSERETFSILVRLKNGEPDKILMARSEQMYLLTQVKGLLEHELRLYGKEEETVSYKVFEVKGELNDKH